MSADRRLCYVASACTSFDTFRGEVAAIELLLLKKHAMLTSGKVPTILRLSSAVACDTAIAGSLSYYLHTKRTGFKRSDKMINYLILFSINSGLLLRLNSRQVLFNDTFDEKDGPIVKVKHSTRHRSRRSNANWVIDRSKTPDKTPTQIYVVTETIIDNVPQHLDPEMIRSPKDTQGKQLSESSSSSGSDSSSELASQRGESV
ncbi:hypothetical protein JR316_0010019 [Psilocybe cubensis]|uniref:Uncharacterized protein n=1 Tax=Psilocybe cubensis TaxID=181762 RepID=A0ACB8GPX5_PSICU|nr:hypothetical protein JR316_0010019 [Psilocybe cubensis]KAH9477790.1 hypothetical protein JR316_0010019 [Psilocybe cubensis]